MEESSFKIDPERCLFLNSDFSEKDANLVIRQLNNLNLENGDIFIKINSNGGSFTGAKKIYDNISTSRNNVLGIVMGDAFSSAAIVLQACQRKYATRLSRLHIHRVSYPITFTLKYGDTLQKLTKVVANELKVLEEDNKILVQILKRNSKISNREVSKILDEDKTISPKEALKIGLIDEII